MKYLFSLVYCASRIAECTANMSITLAYYTVAWFFSLTFIINHIVVSRFPKSQLRNTVCFESAEASLYKKVNQWGLGGSGIIKRIC